MIPIRPLSPSAGGNLPMVNSFASSNGKSHKTSHVDPKRLIFVDETWAKTNMTPIPRSVSCGLTPSRQGANGHRKTLTFIAALRCDGICAPCLLDQPINSESQ
jgi:hypothetical protein